MKVYLVSRSEPYEGQDIQEVFLHEEAAVKYAKEKNDVFYNRRTYPNVYKVGDVYEVIPFEVIE